MTMYLLAQYVTALYLKRQAIYMPEEELVRAARLYGLARRTLARLTRGAFTVAMLIDLVIIYFFFL